MVKLLKLSDKVWINMEKISYIYKNEFLEGTIIYFEVLNRLTLNDEQSKVLFKEIRKLNNGF
jgi:hypothetical protein